MCGILGIHDPRIAGDEARLRAAAGRLAHRGPDAEGIWQEGEWSLGHRRLAIIDLDARANQPFVDASHALVFNGEIYNYRRLRDELRGLGAEFHTDSDTEVVLRAWQQWGVDCLPRFDGMFAFVLVERASGAVVCARDRFGEKPLFVRARGGGFAFASELAALAALDPEPLEVDPAARGLYFAFSYIPAPWSIYRGVELLRPGHFLSWRPGASSVEQHAWYRPQPRPGRPSGGYLDGCRQLRQMLEDSVRDRLQAADVPVAVFCSGGIDSAIVTALADRLAAGPVRAYSVAFPKDPDFDEGPYARAVVERCHRVDHVVVDCDEEKLAGFLESTVDHLSEPYGDASIIPTAFVSAQVDEKVVLGGDGADEVLGGYGVYPAMALAARLPPWLRRLLRSLPANANGEAIRQPLLRRAALWHHRLGSDPVDDYLRWRRYGEPRRLRQLGLDTTALPMVATRLADLAAGGLTAVQVADLRFNLADDMLRKVDYASMAWAKEVRLPYLQADLVETVLGWPESWRISGGRRKRILVDAFRDLLPASLLTRGKQGFLLPVRAWLRSGSLAERLRAAIEGQTEFPVGPWLTVLDEHRRGAADHTTLLWCLLVYLRWRSGVGA